MSKGAAPSRSRPPPAPYISGDPRGRGDGEREEKDCDGRGRQRSSSSGSPRLPELLVLRSSSFSGPRVPPPGAGSSPASGWEPGSPREALDSQDRPLSSTNYALPLWASRDPLKTPAGPDPADPPQARPEQKLLKT